MNSIHKILPFGLMLISLLTGHSADAVERVQQVAFSDVTTLDNRHPDHIIRYGEHDTQFLEFWQARSTERPAAAVVLVHGGCWLNAFGVDHTRAAATTLADLGFAVWSVEYRRLGDEGGGWPNSRDDIVSAIDLVTDTAQRSDLMLPADSENIIVVGHSAGGHLALHAVERTQVRPVLTIGLAAITDITAYTSTDGSCQRAAADFMATANQDQTDALTVSPDSELSRILFYGQADGIVEPAQANLGATQAISVNHAGHFDFIHPHTPAWNTWLQYIRHALEDKSPAQ